MCCSTHIIFCGKCDIDSSFKLLVIVAIVIPEVNIWFGITQISESELALQCIINKGESLFLFKWLVIKRSLKKT